MQKGAININPNLDLVRALGDRNVSMYVFRLNGL